MNSTKKPQNPKNFTPNSDIGGTAGYAGSAFTSDVTEIAKVADKYLKDSLLLNKLTERVYQLLLEDMRIQRERINGYGNQRW
ncbi:MAG: hypothetical protein ACKO11_03700 [Cuspidothrix sp.]